MTCGNGVNVALPPLDTNGRTVCGRVPFPQGPAVPESRSKLVFILGFIYRLFPRQPLCTGRIIMTQVGEIYKCELCGNVVEVKEAGGGELVCCGEPMEKQES